MRMFVNGREVDPRQAGGGNPRQAGGGDGRAGGAMQQMRDQMGQMQLDPRGGGRGGVPMQHGGGGGARGGADALQMALRASEVSAAAEDARRLREGLVASGAPGGPAQHGGGGARRADIDLQRALEASVARPPQQQRMPQRRY